MNLRDLRATSTLVAGLDDDEYKQFESMATKIKLAQDEVLFRENDKAKRFFVIVRGIISLEVERAAKPSTTVQTVSEGALLGLSWRLEPHRWMWSARALTKTKLAAFDAEQVRQACAEDPKLDKLMWEAIAREASSRLHHTRVQLLDLYGGG